jgi:hypothetical protein
MRIHNVHERILPPGGTPESLIDGLAGDDDRLWPHDRWPAMRFEGGMQVGNQGGHGPIRYGVLEHQPGQLARFGFTGPPGLIGEHRWELDHSRDGVVLRHVLTGHTEGRMHWQWPLLFEPLHDALVEDALDHAVAELSEAVYRPARWRPRARVLRWLLDGLI